MHLQGPASDPKKASICVAFLRMSPLRRDRACWLPSNRVPVMLTRVVRIVAGLVVASASVLSSAADRAPPSMNASDLFNAVSASIVIVETSSAEGRSQGSGVVFSNGHDSATQKPISSWIVTNAHVIKGARSVSVRQGAATYAATVEAVDEDSDLAMLLIEKVALPAIGPGRVAKNGARIGEPVFAIGAPRGLELSITEGVVSGLRDRGAVKLVQTSAAISPGNSGGGLFSSAGKLVGITTFKLRDSEGLNFAVDARHVSLLMLAQMDAFMLRAYASAMEFDPSQKAALQSPQLLSWLLRSGPSGGRMFLGEAANMVDSSPSGTEANVKKLHVIVSQYLAATPRQVASSDTVTLVCKMNDTGGYFPNELTATIDFKRSTWNGKPARITDGEIAFVADRLRLSISRYTGALSIGDEQKASVFTGNCAPATERRF